jgi:micrococcal nuclease
MYEYGIKFKRVIDGDTFVCDIDLGFGIWLVDQHCRLHGIDTPEKKTAEGQKCILEAKFWFDDAAARLEKFTVLVEAKEDKYGRRLVQVRTDKSPCTLNEQLVRDGLAVPYSGGSKAKAWTVKKVIKATPIVS